MFSQNTLKLNHLIVKNIKVLAKVPELLFFFFFNYILQGMISKERKKTHTSHQINYIM